MAKKPRVTPEQDPDYSILGDAPVLTVQQQRQLEKEKKAAKKAARKAQMKDMSAEAKERIVPTGEKRITIIIFAVMAILVAAVVASMVMGQPRMTAADKEARDTDSFYRDYTQTAEFGESGITAAVNEVYYTKSDGIRVIMNLANAEDATQHPTYIYIKLMNGDGEVIADGATTQIKSDYYIVGGGRKDYELFIPKKRVRIGDDPLTEISYEVVIDCEDYNSDAS